MAVGQLLMVARVDDIPPGSARDRALQLETFEVVVEDGEVTVVL
jgi:hypothetical protein